METHEIMYACMRKKKKKNVNPLTSQVRSISLIDPPPTQKKKVSEATKREPKHLSPSRAPQTKQRRGCYCCCDSSGFWALACCRHVGLFLQQSLKFSKRAVRAGGSARGSIYLVNKSEKSPRGHFFRIGSPAAGKHRRDLTYPTRRTAWAPVIPWPSETG